MLYLNNDTKSTFYNYNLNYFFNFFFLNMFEDNLNFFSNQTGGFNQNKLTILINNYFYKNNISGFSLKNEYYFLIRNNFINYISVTLSFFYIIVVFFILFVFLFTLFCPVSLNLYSNDLFLFSIDTSYGLVEAEKEVGPVDDIILPAILILLSTVSWFFLLFPLQVISINSIPFNSVIILFFCILIISLPINLLYECGFFFSTFFRGAAGSTSTLMEFVYDLIANTTMFARMQVQHVRVLLGLAMYVETATYLENLSLYQFIVDQNSITISHLDLISKKNSISYLIAIISKIVITILEIGHYIMFLLQSSASYLALIFWLFSLLYSGSFKETIEVYFANKSN